MNKLTDEALCEKIRTRLDRVNPEWIAINEKEMHNLDMLAALVKEHKRRKMPMGRTIAKRIEKALILRDAFCEIKFL
jgi:predicted secreted Zn-dependent protease